MCNILTWKLILCKIHPDDVSAILAYVLIFYPNMATAYIFIDVYV